MSKEYPVKMNGIEIGYIYKEGKEDWSCVCHFSDMGTGNIESKEWAIAECISKYKEYLAHLLRRKARIDKAIADHKVNLHEAQ